MNYFQDPIINQLHKRVENEMGPLSIRPALPEERYYQELAESIISQQLAIKAAAKITERVRLVVGDTFSPQAVMAVPFEELRAAGLSQAKTHYVRNTAEAWLSGQIVPSQLTVMDEVGVIEQLSSIKGVGRWTAEMFLIFCLARPDVFSVGDYGLRKAMIRAYDLPETAQSRDFLEIAEQWRPQRTLASLILWKSLELV